MTSRMKGKAFDCVESMREIRDRISAEISGKTHDELARWFRAYRYSDPVLQHLANRIGPGKPPRQEAEPGSAER